MYKKTLDNRRILTIDDNLTIHDDFRKILATDGISNDLDRAGTSLFDDVTVTAFSESFELSFADQGEAGFRLVEQAVGEETPYALAFVDMRMPPGWDGVETIEHIWKVDSDIQVVICTAFSDHPWHRIAERLGGTDRLLILRKPFDAIEVQQLASALTRKWDLAQQMGCRLKELAIARDAALESVRVKSEFLATVSHEIRTPMNGVIGMTSLLLDTALDADQKDYVEIIRGSGEALLTIINDILDLSKIEAGKLRLENLAFDLRVALDEVMELMADRAESKGLEFACLVQSNVSNTVRGDHGRLGQILRNLIGNAIKFTDQGEVVVRVSVENEDEASVLVRFEVVDTGIGIAAEDKARLFQSFCQVDGSHSRRYGGTGLGLAISKQLAEHMGGSIGMDSELGKGSTFWFTVRLEKCQPALTGPLPQPKVDLNGVRLLIVSNNSTVRTILSQHTTQLGLAVTCASDAAQGLQLMHEAVARHSPYEFALLDHVMTGMTGLQAARMMKTDEGLRQTRIILLGAVGRRADAEEARNIGVVAYLTKPIRQSLLSDCMAAIVESHCKSTGRSTGIKPAIIDYLK